VRLGDPNGREAAYDFDAIKLLDAAVEEFA
jgi:hypothetical protein